MYLRTSFAYRSHQAYSWLTLVCFTLLALVLSAYTAMAQEKPVTLVQRQADITAGNYALVIGIEKYQDPNILPLQFCEDDALAMVKVLKENCGYPEDHIYSLIGAQATLDAILTRVNNLARKDVYSQAQTVVFYFSGHGTAINDVDYLVPYDGSAKAALAVKKNIAFETDILAPLKRNFATQVMFMDACRNFADPYGKGTLSGGFVDPKLAADAAKGTFILFGTQFGEISREDPALGHGLFTEALVDGLSGAAADNDGLVHVTDLAKQVASYMQRYSQEHPDATQLPTQSGDCSPLIVLAAVDKSKYQAPTAPAAQPSPATFAPAVNPPAVSPPLAPPPLPAIVEAPPKPQGILAEIDLAGTDDPVLAKIAGQVLGPDGDPVDYPTYSPAGWADFEKQILKRNSEKQMPFAFMLLSCVHWCLGNTYDEHTKSSLSYAQEAQKIAPDSAWAYYRMGEAYT
jgi:hypothetical protein